MNLHPELSGAFTVFEHTLAPHASGPPLHIHPTLETSYQVLEGRVDFRLDETLLTALPGAAVVAPPTMPHTYANAGGEPVRLLVVCEPNGETDGVHRTDIVGPPFERVAGTPAGRNNGSVQTLDLGIVEMSNDWRS